MTPTEAGLEMDRAILRIVTHGENEDLLTPSTRYDEAFLCLVEWCEANGCEFEVYSSGFGDANAHPGCRITNPRSHRSRVGSGSTLALAICRALLAAAKALGKIGNLPANAATSPSNEP